MPAAPDKPLASPAPRPLPPTRLPRVVAIVALVLGLAMVTGSLAGAAASAGPASTELARVYSEGLALAVSRGVLPPDLAARAMKLADLESRLAQEEQASILAELEAALAKAPAPSAADQVALDSLTARFGAFAMPAAAEVASPGLSTEASDPCEDDCNWAYWQCAFDCWLDWAACVAKAKSFWGVLACYAHYIVCLSVCGGQLKHCLEECAKHDTVAIDVVRIGLPPITVTVAGLSGPTSGLRPLGGLGVPAGASG